MALLYSPPNTFYQYLLRRFWLERIFLAKTAENCAVHWDVSQVFGMKQGEWLTNNMKSFITTEKLLIVTQLSSLKQI